MPTTHLALTNRGRTQETLARSSKTVDPPGSAAHAVLRTGTVRVEVPRARLVDAEGSEREWQTRHSRLYKQGRAFDRSLCAGLPYHKFVRVNDSAWLALPKFRRQL